MLQAYTARAPIQQQQIAISDPHPEDSIPKTRVGYFVSEAYSAYEEALGQTGTAASGRALHFAADLICSGGVDIWIRGAYAYAVQHIGLGNPRILVYLRQRIAELDKKASTLPSQSFYINPEVQQIICEVVLVLQLCPKRAKVGWPKVEENTKREGWLRGVASAPEARAVRAVWSSDTDNPTLFLVGNEFCRAVEEGAIERALFWVRWVQEEDARLKKEMRGYGLSSKERGSPSQGQRAKTDAGHFMAAVMLEIYRDFKQKGLVRMDEEFAELLRLWRCGESRMAARLRKDCLGWLVCICCEVPRWKVPAAPKLVEDPMRLSRAVSQAGQFFQEVLAYPALPATAQITTKMLKMRLAKSKKLTEAQRKQMEMDEQFDSIMDLYLKR